MSEAPINDRHAPARVLIIDDEPQIRFLARLMLEDEGFEVDDAPDGDAGLARYAERRADVVVCDMNMPGRDGLETIAALLDADPEARVVLATGTMAGSEVFTRLRPHLDALFLLDKPFTASGLAEAVREALGSAVARA